MKWIPLLAAAMLLAGCSESANIASRHDAGSEETVRGPHGGRMLEDGAFALELAIFERGVPPEYRAWVTKEGRPVDPSQVRVAVNLERFGGVVDRIAFEPREDYLRGTTEVVEPHSFVVTVEAEAAGDTHRWTYESFEGRTAITAAAAREAGIAVEQAGPRAIDEVISLYGVIAANPEAVRSVAARYPGPIRTVLKALGDSVRRGEVLATVESNESLQTYTVTAPIDGIVTSRQANPGEAAGAEPLFVITNLATVTADLSVFPRDLARVRAGQHAVIRAVDGGEASEGRVVHVSPTGAGANQALIVRVRLDNQARRWTPGIYVHGDVIVGGREVPVAVKADALQRFRDWQVVFVNRGEIYQAQPIETGGSDGEWVEVVNGLAAGTPYVTRNSFIVKADIEKSGASHDH